MRFHPPPALSPGARIAVIAPSSPFDREAFDAGVERLGRRYRIRYGRGLFARKGYLAGDDARRRAEFLEALDDPEVSAIAAARGGYGATRLLDALDADRVREAGKLLIGFSDVTALHALWARAGLRSLHAPMVAALGRAPDASVQRWIASVEGACPVPVGQLHTIAGGRVRGPLLGGNLAVLAALVGTPYAPPLDDAVLFLEDVGERPYRVDRMLTTLRQAGWLDRVRGVLLGVFSESTPGPDGVEVDAVLRERLGTLMPVLAGIPAGHVDDNLELPLGAPVELDADAGTVRFLEAAVHG